MNSTMAGRLAAVLIAATPLLTGTAVAAPAPVLEGVHRVEATSPTSSASPKTATAYCPINERVIGGGGWAVDTYPSTLRPRLTELRPNHFADVDGTLDSYVASAAEPSPRTGLDWSVKAYAICAKWIPGITLESSPPSPNTSAPVQATAAACPAGTRVLGSGAASSERSGNVALQVARPSHPGDIARAQAHEGASGFAGTWSVTAYAICAPAPSGYEIRFDESPLRASQPVKIAGTTPNTGCTPGKRLMSSGAGISESAPGNVSVQRIYPSDLAQETYATAVENTPTNLSWDFIVATSVCAY